MKKQAMLFFVLLVLVSPVSYAQDKCTVSGKVVYSGNANIHVWLLNSTAFPAALGRQNEPPPPEFVQIVKADASGKAPFAFKDVPKTEYVLRAFADENNNGTIDRDTMGYPLEPARSHKLPADGIHSNWQDQKFNADKDITDIVVKFQD